MRVSKREGRAARRLYRLCLVDGVLDEGRVRLVVGHIVAAKRRRAVAVLSHFERLVRLDRDRHSARVVSAVPLPDDLRTEMAAGVARMYGSSLETSFSDDPALIGGLRVQVGSDVYDGSVRARLAALEARLLTDQGLPR